MTRRLTNPDRKPLDSPPVRERLVIDSVLYEAECPVVFTTHSTAGQLLLGYAAESSSDGARFVLTACTQRMVDALQSGHIPVRDALISSWMWLAQEDTTGKIKEVWTITEADLPEPHLPARGTLLLPEHVAPKSGQSQLVTSCSREGTSRDRARARAMIPREKKAA